MAAERRSVCLQLVVGKHDRIIELLMPQGETVNKNQIIIDALMLYIEHGGTSSPPPTPPRTPSPLPYDPSGLAAIFETAMANALESKAAVIGKAFAEAIPFKTAFGTNRKQKEKPAPDGGPIRQTAAERAALLADITGGLDGLLA